MNESDLKSLLNMLASTGQTLGGLGNKEVEEIRRLMMGDSEEVQWADGANPGMHVDEDGDLVAGDPDHPLWGKKAQQKFADLQKGDNNIRLIEEEQDRIAVCVDNTGIEDQFDQGIEYIFEDQYKGTIRVYDKTGELRECFGERFKVKSNGECFFKMLKHFSQWTGV